jgi:MGT family glycosyltransferase
VYGCPPAFPTALQPDPEQLHDLRALCEKVRDTFTEEWNVALRTLQPGAAESSDAFAETGDVLLLNYPGELHDAGRTLRLPPHRFLGSAVRSEPADPEVEAWLRADTARVVYVSLGSFLSVRGDVLGRVAEALRGLDVRVALAHGSTPVSELGPVPPSWLVREVLPQVTVLREAALAVTHGGNNSVTEALTAGVPMLVLPLSTDQFAGAAALEEAGVAEVLDPNAAGPSELRSAADRLLAEPSEARRRLTTLVKSLTTWPGPERALEALSRRAAETGAPGSSVR